MDVSDTFFSSRGRGRGEVRSAGRGGAISFSKSQEGGVSRVGGGGGEGPGGVSAGNLGGGGGVNISFRGRNPHQALRETPKVTF